MRKKCGKSAKKVNGAIPHPPHEHTRCLHYCDFFDHANVKTAKTIRVLLKQENNLMKIRYFDPDNGDIVPIFSSGPQELVPSRVDVRVVQFILYWPWNKSLVRLRNHCLLLLDVL